MPNKKDIRIEYPSTHTTFTTEEYGVFEYGEYPRSSVLHGRERRSFVDTFPTLAAARAAYPDAYVSPGVVEGMPDDSEPNRPPYTSVQGADEMPEARFYGESD